MSRNSIETRRPRPQARSALADVASVATIVALIASLAVAAITVSIGIARADTVIAIAEGGDGRLAAILFLAFIVTALGLTAFTTRGRGKASRCD